MSRKPGIGSSYIDSHKDYHLSKERFYGVLPGGTKVALPRYYVDRIFSPETREHHFSRISDFKPLLDHETFLRTNPTSNPFKYEYELKKDYSDRLFKRITKLDKL